MSQWVKAEGTYVNLDQSFATEAEALDALRLLVGGEIL